MKKRFLITGLNPILLSVLSLLPLLTSPVVLFGQTEETISQDTLSLKQCIEIALENSPEISIAEGNVNKSELDVDDAKAGYLPTVNLNGEYRVNDSYDRMEWNTEHYDLGISATINPFNSGKTYLSKQRAEASLSSTREDYKLNRMNLIMEVINKYYNLLEASQILELRMGILEQKQKQLDFSKTQFELGIVPRADTLKARAALEGARLDLHETTGKLQIRRAELNESMGIDLNIPISVEPVELKERSIPEPDSMLNLALSERPEIKQQESLISSNKYSLYIARINRMPHLTISGGYDVIADDYIFEGEDFNNENWEDNTSWSVNVGLTLPIFDGGIKSRDITRAGIDLNNSRLRYKNLKRRIELEVQSSYIALVNSSKKIDLTKRQVISNEESYQAALGRYRNGIAPITEVLDAEVALTESRVNQITAKYDFLVSMAILKKASGVLYIEEVE